VGYVELGGVRTWYEVQGEGEPLVLLHPGGFDSRAMESPAAELAASYTVYLLDRRGHGRTPDVPGELSYEAMGADTTAFIETVIEGPAHLVGHSDGAVVGLLVAQQRPDLVRSLVFSSGVWHHSGWLPGVLELDEGSMSFMRSWYEEVSPDGPEHFEEFTAKLDRMHLAGPTLTPADLAGIPVRTLVMAADDDEMAPEHLIALYRALPSAQLAIVPGTSHGLLLEKPELCMMLIKDFVGTEEIAVIAPVSRAG
jgi:pimeloyl-ACP methyl ester carboxylesterase